MITLSYGGGVQTIAIITLILEGKLPLPDYIVMADTGREVSTTFAYLRQIVQPALGAVGMMVHIADHELSKVDLWKSGDRVLLPAFTTNTTSKIGRLPTYCSHEWKQRVIRRWLRANYVKATDLWLGISTDEIHRMKPADRKWINHIYPLIELAPMSRAEFLTQIERFGWPTPHKSRCWMCPQQSTAEWRELKESFPAEFSAAATLEQAIHEKDQTLWLTKWATPLPKVDFGAQQAAFNFDGCDSGYCFV